MSKINTVFKICVFVIIALVVFSCKTTPKEEPVQEQPPVETPVQEKPVEPVKEPVKQDKTAQLQELKTAIEKARQKAIESGAQSYMPELLSSVDDQYADYASMDASDQDAVLAKGQSILEYYEALEQSSLALTLKSRIEGFTFQSYDRTNYDLGVESLASAAALYAQEGKSSEVKAQATTARTAFQSVLDAAFMSLSQDKRSDVITARANADSIKAGVADKSGYNSAMLKFSSAETKMAEKSYENAYNLYVDSHNALLEIYERVLQKRQAAEEAIARAKGKNEAVDRYALEADAIAPLSEQGTTEEAVQ